tara:strand:+ start:2703 stop:3353 length:651 start_codon:yes stop_codon:yes gene_type:complete
MAVMDAAIEGGIAGARPDITDLIKKTKGRIGAVWKHPGTKALKSGLGWYLWDMAFPNALGGEQDYESGRTADILVGPRLEGIDHNEPIVEGWSLNELAQDPEIIAEAKKLKILPIQYAADIADYYMFAETEGPYSPGELPWEYIEEQYGDTPWFQEYKEDKPWIHSAARGFDKYVNNPLGEGIASIAKYMPESWKAKPFTPPEWWYDINHEDNPFK